LIYADNAATTRISDSVFEKMLPFLRGQYGNASSQYSLGMASKRAIEDARKRFAAVIGADSAEVIFTSGGSEANNWVLRSVTGAFPGENVHIVTSAIEHPSVLNACRALEKQSIEVTYLPVDKNGIISVGALMEAIRPTTRLVSIMLANNEIGTMQPIAKIGKQLRARKILLHTDAVQAVGHIPVNVKSLHIDFLTASAHKFNGAKGTGIVYTRVGIDLFPMIYGGEQEHGLRAGTESVAGIVSAGYAAEESAVVMKENAKKLDDMVKTTIEYIQAAIPAMQINGDTKNMLPGIINLCFDGVLGESLMHLLDLKGICVSTGSACASGIDKPSHVLLALGLTEQQAKSSIRISYGRYNTMNEAETIAAAICDAYGKLKPS